MSLASRITGGGSLEEARRVTEVDATCVDAGDAVSAVAPPVVPSEVAVAVPVGAAAVLKPELPSPAGPAAVPDTDGSASRGVTAPPVDAVDDRVSPGGVSGANPGVVDDASVALESVPDPDRGDAIDVEPGLDAGCVAASGAVAAEACEVRLEGVEVAEVAVGVEGEPAVATLACSSAVALDPLRRDDCPPRFEAPWPLAADPFPLEASIRCANKPSKNANRGCEGASCRSLSTFARASLRSSAVRADSVCATRSVTPASIPAREQQAAQQDGAPHSLSRII
jgi:hypothetical protein